jgi:hypothetical protein
MVFSILLNTVLQAQCVDPGSSVGFTNTGQAGAGYTTTYVLTNGSDIIQSIVTNPFNAPVTQGNYRLYAVNYKTGETDPVITAGADIHSIGGSCVAISSNPVDFSVCICVSPDDAVFLSSTGNNTAASYQTRYVMTNASGTILNTSSTSSINSPTGSGEYLVYSLNYKTGETDPVVTAGTNISAIGGSCTNLSSSFVRFKVCGMYDYGNLPAGWPVAYAGVSCMLSGNAPLAYNAVTNPFYAVYAGTQISLEGNTPSSGIDAGNDGLVIPPTVTAGAGPFDYRVVLNANASGQTVYYRLWFDWNNDGNFANDADANGSAATYTGTALSAGAVNIDVPVLPPASANSSYRVRLAVSSTPIDDIYGSAGSTAILFIPNGEVEDYTAGALVLPVSLLSFDASKIDKTSALLKWTSVSEENAREFVIERSANGGSGWKDIGTVPASGNSSLTHNYSFTDKQVLSGNNYYRLRIVDADGKISYSLVRSLSFGTSQDIKAYPNPVKDLLYLSLPAGDGNQTVVIRDITSRELVRKHINGVQNTSIDMSGFTPGLYTVELLKNNRMVFQKKIVKTGKD